MIDTTELGAIFVHAADTLVKDFDVVEFLHGLTEAAGRVGGADAVGLMLADHRSQLQYVASSNHDGHVLEVLQVGLEEGPCRDAYASGAPVVNTDLTSAQTRWPRFAEQAAAGGYTSVHAFPLRLRAEAVGAMGLFSTDASAFTPDEAATVQALADVATISILQDRALTRAEALTEQLQGALNSRIVIEQAKGAIAMVAGCSVAEAFTMLRDRSRRHGLKLTDVAQTAIDDPRETASWWRSR
ncbi:GAF and ANTAR domain-containing protein [Solicola sp. PLA-1-18]|uniref:GAF and ANTAR domain-containing protein n=1 Tax=Solicola sp. PLA-1-18 TaxID=3380532 RepID=UPI003B781764